MRAFKVKANTLNAKKVRRAVRKYRTKKLCLFFLFCFAFFFSISINIFIFFYTIRHDSKLLYTKLKDMKYFSKQMKKKKTHNTRNRETEITRIEMLAR